MKRIVRVVEVEPEEERLARLIFENQRLVKNNRRLKFINKEINKKVKKQKGMLNSLLKKIDGIQRRQVEQKDLRSIKGYSPMYGCFIHCYDTSGALMYLRCFDIGKRIYHEKNSKGSV